MTRTITLTNDYHNTSINLRPTKGELSISQVKRARRELCPNGKECICSGPVGVRGPQSIHDGRHYIRLEIEPVYYSDRLAGAKVHVDELPEFAL